MTKKDVFVFVLVYLSLAMIFINLKGQEIKIKQEDGITVVNNPINPVKSLDSSIEMVLKEDLILGTNEKNTNYYFEVIGDIKADENGNIYVVDSRANSVKVFDGEGKYLKDIGRQGQGPGELMAPMGMTILADKITVYSAGRLSFFTLKGNFIKHNKVMFGRLMCFDSEGNIITKVPGPPGNVFKEFLRKFNPEGKLILEVAEIIMPPSPNEKRKAFPENVLFTIRQDDCIVWTNRSQYEVNVVSKDGKAFLKIKKEYNPVKLTEKHKQSFLAHYRAAEDQYRQFDAVITRVKPFGIYFDVLDFMLEGFLHVSELDDDYFEYQQEEMELVGRNLGLSYKAGDRMQVIMSHVELIK